MAGPDRQSGETPAQAELVAHLLAKLAEQEAELAERDRELARRGEALAAQRAKVAELQAEKARLWRAYEQLKEELLLVKRRLFIAKAERVDTAQLELEFAELTQKLSALAAQIPAEEDDDGEPEEPGRRKKRKPKGRRNLAEADLPEVKVEIPDALFEQLVADGKAERIGAETSYKLGYERGGFRRIAIARIKYRALDARGRAAIETAPLPPELLRRCLAAPSLLAHLCAQKLNRGLPLYRLEEASREEGAPLDRGTMSRWLEEAGGTCGATVIAAMEEDALTNAFCIATDATGFAVQPGAREGPRGPRRPCRKGHYFVRIADRDHILFDFTPKHTSKVVRVLFKGFKGYVQADAASVYDALFRPSEDDDEGEAPREVGCWSHARRKYWEAAFSKEPVAREALLRIGTLFEMDARIRGKRRPPSKIRKLRNKHLRPRVEDFLAFAEAEYEQVKDQRGTLRSALGYTVRQAEALCAFLEDGRLKMDNNRSEGELRKIVRIRDAALFAGSDEHAEAAGHLLSLIASARLHGLDPERYLRELFRVLPCWPRGRYLELSPKHWAKTRARLDPRQLVAEAGWLRVPGAKTTSPVQ